MKNDEDYILNVKRSLTAAHVNGRFEARGYTGGDEFISAQVSRTN